MEIGFFISALILLTALIYGSLTYRYRDRRKSKVADQIVRDRYEHNQTWSAASLGAPEPYQRGLVLGARVRLGCGGGEGNLK
jgi:hypothetical protein